VRWKPGSALQIKGRRYSTQKVVWMLSAAFARLGRCFLDLDGLIVYPGDFFHIRR
jgi:hypothetical protein